MNNKPKEQELYANPNANGHAAAADFFTEKVERAPRSPQEVNGELYSIATPGNKRGKSAKAKAKAQGSSQKPKARRNTQEINGELYSIATPGTQRGKSAKAKAQGSSQKPKAPRNTQEVNGELYSIATPGTQRGKSAKASPPPEEFFGFDDAPPEDTYGFDVYEVPAESGWKPLKNKFSQPSGLECKWVPTADNASVYRPVFRFSGTTASPQQGNANTANELLNIAFLVYPTTALGVVQKQWLFHNARTITISNVVVGAALIGAMGGIAASSLSGGQPDPVSASSVSTVQPVVSQPGPNPNNFTTTTTGTGTALPTVTPPSETTTTLSDTISSTVSSITSGSSTTSSQNLISDTTTASTSAITSSLTTNTATSSTGSSETATTFTTDTATTPTTTTTTTTGSTLTTVTQTTSTVTTTTITSFTEPNTEQTGATAPPRRIRLHRREITNTTQGLSLGFNDLSLYLRVPSPSWWRYMNSRRFILPLAMVASITAAIAAYFVARCNKKQPITPQSIDYGVWNSVANIVPDNFPVEVAKFGGVFANQHGDFQAPTRALMQADWWPGKPDLRVTVYITLRAYLYSAFGMDPTKNLDTTGKVPRRYVKRKR